MQWNTERLLKGWASFATLAIIMITAASWDRVQAYVANDVYVGEFTGPYGPVKIYTDTNQPRDKTDDGGFMIQIGGTVPNQQFFDQFVNPKDYIGAVKALARRFSWSLSVNCAHRSLRSWSFFWYDTHNDIIAIQQLKGASTEIPSGDARSLNAAVIKRFCG